jgi:hypothetical protein
MGHRGDVYERYYMPAFIDKDCQAIYLGSTRRDDLIRSVGRLARHEQAPTALTDTQKFTIEREPDIVNLIKRREKCVQIIKAHGYATIKAAVGTEWHAQHREAQAKINNLRSQKRAEMLKTTIEDFHKTVHTVEVDRQLQGIRPADILTPPTIHYELEERATIARLLFEPLDGLTEDQVLQVRIELVEQLVGLCKCRQTPHQYQMPKSRGRSSKNAGEIPPHPHRIDLINPNLEVDVALGLQELPNNLTLYCPLCRWNDKNAGPRKRNFVFSRHDSLGRHVRTQHLQYWTTGEGLSCPYPNCSAFLGNPTHFLNHTTRQHNLAL